MPGVRRPSRPGGADTRVERRRCAAGRRARRARRGARQLADELEELGPPETEAGGEIRAELDALADDLERDVDRLQGIPDDETSVSGALANVSKVTDILADASAEIGSTFEALGELDPGDALTDAVAAESRTTVTGGS